MQYALVGLDVPNSVQKRLGIRPDHLKFLEALGDGLVLAGPFLNEAGEGVGTIMVIEAGSLAEAREIFARDPYAQAGLFEQVTIKPWKLTLNKTR